MDLEPTPLKYTHVVRFTHVENVAICNAMLSLHFYMVTLHRVGSPYDAVVLLEHHSLAKIQAMVLSRAALISKEFCTTY